MATIATKVISTRIIAAKRAIIEASNETVRLGKESQEMIISKLFGGSPYNSDSGLNQKIGRFFNSTDTF